MAMLNNQMVSFFFNPTVDYSTNYIISILHPEPRAQNNTTTHHDILYTTVDYGWLLLWLSI